VGREEQNLPEEELKRKNFRKLVPKGKRNYLGERVRKVCPGEQELSYLMGSHREVEGSAGTAGSGLV